jgi:hypothetical protein
MVSRHDRELSQLRRGLRSLVKSCRDVTRRLSAVEERQRATESAVIDHALQLRGRKRR